MKLFGLFAASIAVFVGIAAYRNGYIFARDEFLAACESALKERLKAPSTYRLIRSRQGVREADPDEAVGPVRGTTPEQRALTTELRQIYERAGAFSHFILLDYEAQNSFGVPLADTAVCEVFTHSRDAPGRHAYSPSSVRINGKTNFDLILDGLSGR